MRSSMMASSTFLIVIFFFLSLGYRVKCNTKYSEDTLCREEWFQKNVVDKDQYVALNDMQKLCNVSYHSKCSVIPSTYIFWTLVENTQSNKYFLRVSVSSIGPTFFDSGCWGIGFEATTSKTKQLSYTSKGNMNGSIVYFDVHYMISFNYTINVMALPTGRTVSFKWKAPGRCELLVLDGIYRVMHKKRIWREEDGCMNIIDAGGVLEFARKICRLHQDDEDFYKVLKDRLDVIRCVPTLNPIKLKKKVENKSLVVSISISVVVAVSIFVVFAIVVKKQKLKLCSKSMNNNLSYEESSLVIPKELPTVMIIHRSGCEIMESFVQELASLLQSYGVNMKMTSSESHVIDAEGGIASYLQKNINYCDYVLIMITEHPGSEVKTKHRAYEFALKMMEGNVVHGCAHAQYLPIYMTTYNKAIKYFPPFLKASTSYGYQIPDDTLKLLYKLINTSERNKSKERIIKDKTFVKHLTDYSKNYASALHVNCNKDECSKGQHLSISDNLSSVWASTLHSKWPSERSLAEVQLDYILENDTGEQMVGYFDKDSLVENGSGSSIDCHFVNIERNCEKPLIHT